MDPLKDDRILLLAIVRVLRPQQYLTECIVSNPQEQNHDEVHRLTHAAEDQVCDLPRGREVPPKVHELSDHHRYHDQIEQRDHKHAQMVVLAVLVDPICCGDLAVPLSLVVVLNNVEEVVVNINRHMQDVPEVLEVVEGADTAQLHDLPDHE